MSTSVRLVAVVLGVAVCGAWSVRTVQASSDVGVVDRVAAVSAFREAFPQARFYEQGERIASIYGSPFGHGVSPEDAAERFRSTHSGVFGVSADQLDARGPLPDERHTLSLMYDRDTDSYTFTLVYYTQRVSGVPVFRSDLRLLVRNEPGFPLVLARNGLRDLDGYAPNTVATYDPALGVAAAGRRFPTLTHFTPAKAVIWAGVEDVLAAPRLAFTFVGDNQMLDSSAPERRLFVTDAASGAILYDEDQVFEVDVTGNVSGMATDGTASDNCEDEVVKGLPHIRVNIGGTSVFADEFGDFTIPNSGTGDVTVQSRLQGNFFRTQNGVGANSTLSMTVSPPGPADFVFNENNTNSLARGEVNGYLYANVVRDFALRHNPSYPVIANQHNFVVNVNLGGGFCPCNAWYSGVAVNFCRKIGTCPNMAFSVVVEHEYGHHLVAMGGSGQGQYGEGTGDLMGLLINDEPRNGVGFFGNCVTAARTAINNIQYPCFGEIHTCGQLLTGAVWETRNELVTTEPDNYLDILGQLAINAILLHHGAQITPQITIDYLTLDDDDATLDNGTPHYLEIHTGFGEHNMPGPNLDTTPPTIVHDDGVGTDPFSGYVDPRAESSDGVNVDRGIDHVTIRFSEVVRSVGGGGLAPGDFEVTGTGPEHPTVTSIDASQNPRIVLTLSGNIPLQQWTTIIAHVEDELGNVIENSGNQGPGANESDRVDIGFLPADVDQSGTVSPFDLLMFRQIVNGVVDPTQGTDADFVDIDRNGTVSPFDLLAFRQLIDGSGNATRSWSGETLPQRP